MKWRLALPSMAWFEVPPAEARLLPEGRMAGPMPWVIAIIIYLTVLAAATGLSLTRSTRGLDADLASRVTVQVVEANPIRRAKEAERIEQRLAMMDAVASFRRVSDDEVADLLAPWFGNAGLDKDLPVPILIDVTLDPAVEAGMATLTSSLADTAPSARVEQHAQWLGPLLGLMRALTWLSGLLVLLMAGAATAIVVLSAKAALNTHRATIEVMHLMGATDAQIARLFQRRIGLDALFGSGIGLVAALVTMALLGTRLSAIGSDLVGSVGLGVMGWLALFAVPVLTTAVATLAARATLVLALRRLL